ncbi:protein-methionine-sulfoxide reductase heme-binding subunit MsrQ [uncultured Tateyamaria sp.]|uniref:protein-methionine-sulfoxide reductase heme-binding subunit MsrQ n=1 Tax=uncultured Tateyamaria sp. TaxID=455651 RepID=UPI002632B5D7|nr:protein-methionine-sulfoxide reductase heme-binding subunit MsrQ [uncultured Tateyamaria sp.]
MTFVDGVNRVARKVPTWAIYIAYLIPVPVLLYMAQTGGLGREPISALEHELGEIALQLLIIGLCISPLRRFFGINLIKFRRAFGLLAFTYVVLHLLIWVVLDMSLLWAQMWGDIWKRPYITVGMMGFVLLIPLAVTSNNRSVRALGQAWRKLHLLAYPAAILGAVHFVMVQRVWEIEPLIYLAVLVGLTALRLQRDIRQPARG